MKTYFTLIKKSQEIFLAVSIIILACLPSALLLKPDWFTIERTTSLYSLAHFSLFLVMVVRPLADIFRDTKWLRPLVILRKGVGVFSAAIIVSFILGKIMTDAPQYFADMSTYSYWSLNNLALFAHAADISAILLLITSNNLSKQLLGKNWKRIQRLSYVYFYGSSLYVYFVLNDTTMLWYMVIVTILTTLAWFLNKHFLFMTTNPQNI